MKKLLFLMLFLPTIGMAQYGYRSEYLVQDTTNGASANKILNRAISTAWIDTCQPLMAERYKNVYLNVQSTDTASIHFKVLLSVDGTTWAPVSAAFDSLSVAAATGGTRTVDIKSTVGGMYFKLVFTQTAYRVPVAGTHLYTAKITMLQ
jgi:hypothetical protein